jgi:hypothetical protein
MICEFAKEAMVAARKHGTFISYDLNYRDSIAPSINVRNWKPEGTRSR